MASRRSRASVVALAVSVLVAVGGVSYAIGRWSVEGSPSGGNGGTLAAAEAAAAGGFALPFEGDGAAPDDGIVDPDGQGGFGGPSAFGGPGGFGGRGGLQGVLTAVGADSLTVDVAGQEQTVGIEEGSTFVRQHAASADEIVPGDLISVGYAFAGSAGGARAGAGGPAAPDGAVLRGDQPDQRGPSNASDLPDAVAATITILPLGTSSGTRFGIEGTVQGAADRSFMVTTADGESRLVSTDETTTYSRDVPISSTDLVVGDSVQIQLAFAGTRGGGGAVPDGSLPSASRVVLLGSDGS